jgi:hypothetical protein
MTTMIDKFFGMPQSVMRSGTWAAMKPSEQTLYVALLHESERYCTREFQRSDARISDLAGISPRACRDARIKLQERGLIRYKRGKGNIHVYTLCNPETGQPWAGDPKQRVPYLKKSDRPALPDPPPSQRDTILPIRNQPESEEFHGVSLSFTRT